MYKASTVATVSLATIGFGLLLMKWKLVLFGAGGVIFALYLAFVAKTETASGPSVFSQIALFCIGAIMTVFSGALFLELVINASDDDPNLVILIAGFIFLPMFILMGISMVLCSLFSRTASHKWLNYLATEPSRYNKKLF